MALVSGGAVVHTYHASTLEVEAGGTGESKGSYGYSQVPVGPVWAIGAAIWNRWWEWGGVPSHYNKWNEHSKILPANDFILFSLQFIETKSHSVIQTSLEFLEMLLPQSLKCLDYRCELARICISETHFQSTWVPCGRAFTHNYSKKPTTSSWKVTSQFADVLWGGPDKILRLRNKVNWALPKVLLGSICIVLRSLMPGWIWTEALSPGTTQKQVVPLWSWRFKNRRCVL